MEVHGRVNIFSQRQLPHTKLDSYDIYIFILCFIFHFFKASYKLLYISFFHPTPSRVEY